MILIFQHDFNLIKPYFISLFSACLNTRKVNGTVLPKVQQNGVCKPCHGSQHRAKVLMLSLNAYCRHKAIVKRLEGAGKQWMTKPGSLQILSALGAFISDNPKTRVVFCRDTFDYPQLFEHEMICEELGRLLYILTNANLDIYFIEN